MFNSVKEMFRRRRLERILDELRVLEPSANGAYLEELRDQWQAEFPTSPSDRERELAQEWQRALRECADARFQLVLGYAKRLEELPGDGEISAIVEQFANFAKLGIQSGPMFDVYAGAKSHLVRRRDEARQAMAEQLGELGSTFPELIDDIEKASAILARSGDMGRVSAEDDLHLTLVIPSGRKFIRAGTRTVADEISSDVGVDGIDWDSLNSSEVELHVTELQRTLVDERSALNKLAKLARKAKADKTDSVRADLVTQTQRVAEIESNLESAVRLDNQLRYAQARLEHLLDSQSGPLPGVIARPDQTADQAELFSSRLARLCETRKGVESTLKQDIKNLKLEIKSAEHTTQKLADTEEELGLEEVGWARVDGLIDHLATESKRLEATSKILTLPVPRLSQAVTKVKKTLVQARSKRAAMEAVQRLESVATGTDNFSLAECVRDMKILADLPKDPLFEAIVNRSDQARLAIRSRFEDARVAEELRILRRARSALRALRSDIWDERPVTPSKYLHALTTLEGEASKLPPPEGVTIRLRGSFESVCEETRELCRAHQH